MINGCNSKSKAHTLACLSVVLAVCSSRASAETTVVDDEAVSVTYSGEWSSELDVLARQGSMHSSSSPGAGISFELTGDFARVLATTGPTRGRARVRLCALDSSSCESAELDEYSKTVQHDQVVFARYGLPSGRYRIELQVPESASGSVSMDGIAYGTALRGTHYIDSRSRCSNSNTGERADAPWCDFSNVNGETLAAGAQLLLARGAVWNQALGKLYGEGTAESWISISAYGEGAAPHIQRTRAASDRAIWLDNPSYWDVSHLQLSNAGAGLVAYFTTNGHAGLRFHQLFTHDNDVVHWRSADAWVPAPDLPGMYHGAAIFITGNVPVTENAAAVSDIEFTEIESARDSDPLDIAGFNPSAGQLNFLSTTLGHHAVRDVRVHNVYFHDAKGAPNFDNVEAFSFFSSRISRMCTEFQEIGTTSLFFWSVDDVTIANNVISDIPFTSSPDGTGTDLESASSRVRFRSNWYANNAGAGIEVLAARGESDFQLDHEVAGNVFFQNGLTGAPNWFMTVPQEASLFVLNLTGKRESATGRAQGNLYFEPGGFTASEPLGLFAWERTGNRSVAARSLFDARLPISGTATAADALRHELFDGTMFRSLQAAGPERWAADNALITPFDFQPPPCATCAVARAWVAPHAGTIAVRGWALKNALGGDGVMLRITQDRTQVWPREQGWCNLDGNDGNGLATYLDDLTVEQGDTIRFEVAAGSSSDNTADLLSWSPTVAYTNIPPNSAIVVQDDTLGAGANQVSYSANHWIERAGAHTSQAADASLSVAFDGTQVTVRGSRGPEQGAAVFTVCTRDGASCVPEATVQLFDSVERTQDVLWTSPLVPLGAYSLRMRTAPVEGGAGQQITFDSATISGNTRFINNDDVGTGANQVEYHGAGWGQTGNIHFHEGTAAEVYYLVRFTGVQATIAGGKNVDRGIAAFSVCDRGGQSCGSETLVDAYSETLQVKQMLWTTPLLAPGEHAIKVRPTQMRNAASAGTIIDFDRAIVD